MTLEQAVERLRVVLAHLWMIRTFLKHAEEIEDDLDMLTVPRTLYDYIRATEPAYERGDAKDFVRRIKGKLPKLRKVAEYYQEEYRNVSDHTNFEMAAESLTGCVGHIETILAEMEAAEASE